MSDSGSEFVADLLREAHHQHQKLADCDEYQVRAKAYDDSSNSQEGRIPHVRVYCGSCGAVLAERGGRNESGRMGLEPEMNCPDCDWYGTGMNMEKFLTHLQEDHGYSSADAHDILN